MAENLFSTFNISGQGLSLQRRRLSAIANNIANANTTKAENGKPYQREVVIVRGTKQQQQTFNDAFNEQVISLTRADGNHSSGFPDGMAGKAKDATNALKMTTARDNAEPRSVYDPSHPEADESGYVKMPNVNIVTEMVDMISAQRAFEANTSVIAGAKNIARDSFDI